MKRKEFIALAAMAALALPLSVFAKSRNEGKMELTSPASIGTTQLKPGTYKVEWKGDGPEVQVNILQHNKTVATTQGKIIDHKRPSQYSDVVLKPIANNNNQKTIDEIDFSNRTEALQITPKAS